MIAVRAMWRGIIRFDGVEVPVKLYSAVESKNVSFRLLHRADGVPVKQVLVNPKTDNVVDYAEAQRGYEVDRDRMVLLEAEELEELEPEASRDIDVLRFVRRGVIDRQWYQRPYYLGPDENGDSEPYFALAAALARSELEGIARWVMRNTRYTGALRLHAGYPMLVTLRDADAVIDLEAVKVPEGESLDPKQLEMAKRLLEMLAGPFEPDVYEDDYRERVLDLIESKKKGRTAAPPKRKREPRRTTDLSQALEDSLQGVDAHG